MEQNIEQNIANVPCDERRYRVSVDPALEGGDKCWTEWKDTVIKASQRYFYGRDGKDSRIDAFIAGADFARNEMQQEIDMLKKELKKAECSNYECKHQEDAEKAIEAMYKLVERTDELKCEIDRLTKQRDDLRAELTLERGSSELFRRQRDEAVKLLVDLHEITYYPMSVVRRINELLKRYENENE